MHAFHRSHGVGEADHVLEIPLLKQTVNECAVENVAGPRRIGDRNLESGGAQKLPTIPEHGAFRASRNTYDRAAIAFGQLSRVLCEIRTSDEVINERSCVESS